jgi:hypothetical protein
MYKICLVVYTATDEKNSLFVGNLLLVGDFSSWNMIGRRSGDDPGPEAAFRVPQLTLRVCKQKEIAVVILLPSSDTNKEPTVFFVIFSFHYLISYQLSALQKEEGGGLNYSWQTPSQHLSNYELNYCSKKDISFSSYLRESS